MSKSKREKQYYRSEDAQDLLLELYGGWDPNVGIYRPKDISIQEAEKATVEKMLKLIPRINKSTRILILDSEFGHTARYILETKECKIECLNFNPIQNTYNRNQVESKFEEKLQKKFNVEEGYFEDIPFPRETFDIVLAQGALMHSDDKLRIFREVHRTLKAEGRFVFSDVLKSDDCSSDELKKVTELLPLSEVYSVEQYEKLARKAFLHKVYLLELPEQLHTHYVKLKEDLDSKKKEVKDYKAYKQYDQDLQTWIDVTEKSLLDWGIFIFQKLND